jgi:hypothetical protein
MATYTGPNYAATAGIPAQNSDTIGLTPEGLITGSEPALVTEDMTIAASQTIAEWTPVGLNGAGDIVPVTTPNRAAGVQASGALTFSGTGTAADTITVGTTVYTLRAAPMTVANEVKIGASAAETAANFAAAINGDAGSGSLYGSLTVPHPDVFARIDASGVVGLVAKVEGAAGNAIASTETGTNTSFGAATLTGGKDRVGVVPIGITVKAIVTTGSATLSASPIYRSGCFNPAMINWPASFTTLEQKLEAFRNAPSPTTILMRPVKAATVVLP